MTKMARDLIIIGAGGDGKNVAEIADEIRGEWNLLGFLDDDPGKQGMEINGVPILGKTADIRRYDNCCFVILLGSPREYSIKRRLASTLGVNPDNYATIVHPSARVSRHAHIGRGSVILPGVTVMANAQIGNHVFVASNVNIGHDARIGDYVTISALVGIAGNVTIEEGCYIGLSASIRDGAVVGGWALVGMGSVVVSDVPPYHVVAGNPARVLRRLDPPEFELCCADPDAKMVSNGGQSIGELDKEEQ